MYKKNKISDTVYNIFFMTASLCLIITGIVAGFTDRSGVTLTVLGFAFLFSILVIVTRFKHVKGFGFQAELWEQKQTEAAELIDRLSLLVQAMAEQFSVVASHLGMIDNGLSNPELAKLLKQLDENLKACSTPMEKQKEIISPIIKRIRRNYVCAAIHLVEKWIGKEISVLEVGLHTVSDSERAGVISKIQYKRNLLKEMYDKKIRSDFDLIDLDFLIRMLEKTEDTVQKKEIMEDVIELQSDIAFFNANLKLRREIDIDYVYNDV